MNATTSPQTLQRHLRLPAIQRPFSRADLVFLGLEHSGPPVEVRIFFNAPQADQSTPTTASAGFAGFFSIFAHGGCFGDEGHCDMPERRATDYRPRYALTPITKHVTVTESVRRLVATRSRTLTSPSFRFCTKCRPTFPNTFWSSRWCSSDCPSCCTTERATGRRVARGTRVAACKRRPGHGHSYT